MLPGCLVDEVVGGKAIPGSHMEDDEHVGFENLDHIFDLGPATHHLQGLGHILKFFNPILSPVKRCII